ncbi:hypothetical protein BOX15_Mlig000975g2 [Macrostomum lignano]|uniref:WSC domain-containing protein n=1 Tax=Macrostomum lignano TaxID=282301 RepID=A0A267FFT7_9PLAT|nr:hypothetical protein BOX15_Mlig000975g2 [Macrostomum lignano]
MAKAPLTGIVQLLLWRLSQNVYFSPHCTFHEVSPDGTRKNKKKPKPVLNKFNKRLCGSVHLITRLDSNMIRTVLLLFCMSAAIYGSLSCPSSKKSKLVALPETQKDPKEHNALRNPARLVALPETQKDPKEHNALRNPDKFKQGAKVYPVLPSSMEACYMAYSDFYEAEYESIAIKEMSHGSHLICATECIRRDLYSKLKYFAIGNGNKCMCAEDLPEKRVPGGSLKLVANTSCSLRCPGNHRESCGGLYNLAYFRLSSTLTPPKTDKFKQGAKVYPVLPSSMKACYMAYSDFYEAEYESIAIKEMSHGSHLICATECIRRDLYSKLKYFAIGNGNKCMCAEDLPEKRVPGGSLKLVANTSCSLRCPGNHRESCGGLYNLAYFRLSSTLTPPKTDKFKQGAKVYPVLPSSMEACYMAYSDFYEAEYESIAIKEMSHGSHLICATECIRRDLYSKLKYFAIGNGNKCMCAEDLPEKRVPGGSLKLVANTSCSLRCPGNHRESCGGLYNLAYFRLSSTLTPPKTDKFKQGAKVYPVLPSSMEACYMAYSDFYEAEYESIAIKEMSHGSHLICATECIRRDLYSKLKYFAIGNGNKCMCAEDLPEKRVPGGSLKLVANTSCSLRCPGNHRESCGGLYNLAYFRLSSTLTPPKTDKFKQGAKVYPVLPSSMEACYMAYSDFYEAEYESIAIKEMSHGSHLICATECIRRDLYSKLKYFAIGNGNKCMCAEDLPEKRVPGGSLKLVANTSCSLRCPGNHIEFCGGASEIAYFRLRSTA